ncbi:hypothetical protein [Geobacter pickeringii]|uniref:Uncharacterized protein n=1 Tax=Geobacter pickeringii TaxID=345632 RepID=A0A0B5BHL8_9BACT|nr:hypothetical protein [Geobacter pickeringii]AJE04674.1 hypothetical protein GPICK_16015 [Geobacter pickeringii]
MSASAPDVQPTAQQRALSDIAAQQFNNYMTTYRPFETKYIADIQGNDAGRQERAAGIANANVAGKPSAITGMDPTSGRFMGAVSGSTTTTANATGNAVTGARQAIQGQTLAAQQGLVNLGQGKAAATQSGMETLASNASRSAINDAYLDINNQRFTNNMIGSGIGAAAYGAKKYGPAIKTGLSNWGNGLNWDGTMTGENAAQWDSYNPGMERD